MVTPLPCESLEKGMKNPDLEPLGTYKIAIK